jgi:NAD(P)-dependent dehydrogenase (short-subunit alcohol dehydrogenase family)
MLLKDKVAVIYGAGGAIGGAVARAFASEGAKVFAG